MKRLLINISIVNRFYVMKILQIHSQDTFDDVPYTYITLSNYKKLYEKFVLEETFDLSKNQYLDYHFRE